LIKEQRIEERKALKEAKKEELRLSQLSQE
jgi:hypothetical protein